MMPQQELPQRELEDRVSEETPVRGQGTDEVLLRANDGSNFTTLDLTPRPVPGKVQRTGIQTKNKTDIMNMEEENSLYLTHNQTVVLSENQWEEEQARRIAILKNACAQHPTWKMSLEEISQSPHLLWPFIYDDKYKVIYCTICKVASTTWKSVFLVLMGKYNSTKEVDLAKWSTLGSSLHTLRKLQNPAEIERRLRTYKKFIFVREPFARELSGYRNKLYKRNRYFEMLVGRKIIQEFRPNPDRKALTTGVGVTFTEFVKHLTKSRLESLDIHWRPMYKMVLPCSVDYDYVGHLETTDWDTKNILQKTDISKVVDLPDISKNFTTSDEIFNSFYQELDPSLLRDMYNTFKFDSELFGYDVPALIAKKLGRES